MRLRAITMAAAVLAAVFIPVSANAVLGEIERVQEPVPGSYVVIVRDEVPIQLVAGKYAGVITQVYQHALHGFAISTSDAVAQALAADPAVAKVEEDGVMRAIATQSNPPYGLDRIDQRALPLNQQYTYTNTGSGLKTYIIDTGIRTTHVDFGGRAIHGRDTVNNDNDATDCNGHGTHVAGTVGGSTYGVAKSTTLVAVRVLDCNGSGTTAGVIAGVDWVTGDHAAGTPAAANMSLGGGASSTMDTAVTNSINDGISYAVAAGNGDALGVAQNACNYSPARVAAAITVSATSSTDAKASFANFGTCVDIFAPGVSVLSSWSTSDTATNTISGTSMASPHVAGVAAQYLQSNTSATPASVASAITTNATTGVVTSPGTGSPNRLLYNAFIGGTPPPNVAPTANFTSSCTGLTCTFTDTSTDSDGTISSRSWNFGDSTTSTATNPSKTYSAAGTYTVSLTVTDNGGLTGSTSKSVTVTSGGSTCGADPNTSIPNLTSGVWTSGTAATTTARWKDYKICVPSGRPSLVSSLDGTAGDLDLYVRFNALPTTSTYTCRGITSTPDEACTASSPSAGWWYVSVYTYNTAGANTSFQIKATY